MVIDTSALVAVYQQEAEGERFRVQIFRESEPFLPASVYLEFSTLRRLRGPRRRWLDALIARKRIPIASIDDQVASIAADAAERYGRGSGHPARLNFGDCLSYAVAKHLKAPLLYKGDDFIHTDVESALAL